MIWIGLLILVLTFAAIIKRYETRMVLFFSGLTMAIISGQPLKCNYWQAVSKKPPACLFPVR